MNTARYDVVILGGGLVGASLALALSRKGLHIAVIEPHPPSERHSTLDDDNEWDARIYAISPANRQWLEQLGAWPQEHRIGNVHAMQVKGDHGGEIMFDAHDAKQKRLASIVENRWLLHSIWQQLLVSEVSLYTPAQVSALVREPDRVLLTLQDGSQLEAALLVGCDGANSWVREQIGIKAKIKPYGQSGVVANFHCQYLHGDIARQWFVGDSILAWLPLPQQRISIVWSHPNPDTLLSLSAEALAEKVAAAGQHALGHFTTLTPAQAFPLRLIQPEHMISQRVVLAGDAAHTVHPLAGQGVNLGFGDARELERLLGNAKGSDVGEWLLLRRYERARREAVLAMQLGCDALHQLFHTQLPLSRWVRNTGLNLTNHIGPVKRQLARYAIGF